MVSDEELIILNCGVGRDSWESLGLQEDPPSHPKGNQSWIFIRRTDAEIEPPILWPTDVKNWLFRKKPCYWERLKGGAEEFDRGWDGWMESPTRWAWVCPSSRSWWRTVSPGVLQSMELQGVGHYWANELNWTGNITNTICNWPVSLARLGLPKALTHIPSQVCPHAQKSIPSIHKAFSEF